MSAGSEVEAGLRPVLCELAGIEAKLVKALPALSAGAATDRLRELVSTHIAETEEHATRLEKCARHLGVALRPESSAALERVLAAATDVLGRAQRSLDRDLAIIEAARRAEELEIAAYAAACSRAQEIGSDPVFQLLEKTRREEEQAERLLAETAAEIKSGAIHRAPISNP